MPTVFSRIWAHHKKTGEPLLPVDDRFDIGKKAIDEFRKTFKKGYWKVDSKEPGFVGTVNCYPKKFTARLDKLILNRYRLNKRKAKQQ